MTEQTSFFDHIEALSDKDYASLFASVTPEQVERALARETLSEHDLLALLSPAAANHLERMATLAHERTIKHFGKTILLYTPLYLSNYCINYCVYCGFNAGNQLDRKALSLSELDKEAAAIAATGLEHILILTGESRPHSPVQYIKDCVRVLKRHFASISIEIYPLDTDEYAELAASGVDGLTLYQEVYDRRVYADVHPKGPKRDYRYRLEAPERAGAAGMRTINIGSLLGLASWRTEAFYTAVHAAYLQQRFPETEVSVSCPRMRPQYGGCAPPHPVTDQELVQIILATRLFLPRAGITLSTRETAALRDNLVRLGITKMSAGSSTAVGGHTDREGSIGQFEVADHRTVAEMRAALAALGYKPILKDWHPSYLSTTRSSFIA